MSNYLICDVDDSIIKTDLLFEQWLVLLQKKPVLFITSIFWLIKGLAFFKQNLAKNTHFDASLLPYRQNVIDYITNWKIINNGTAFLISASPEIWVNQISNHLKLFEISNGSTIDVNLKGASKMNRIRTLVRDGSFTYIGDSTPDLKIWKNSAKIVAVNPSWLLKLKILRLKKETFLINDKPHIFSALWKQLRPHQWVKNLLVFLPLLTAHRLNDINLFSKAIVGFFIFSIAASFVYTLNDLSDLNSDRNHQSKRNRPIAAGNLSIKSAILLLPFLFLLLSGLLIFSTPQVSVVIAIYLLLNIAYSFKFKQLLILDVVALSLMYTLRIFAGSAAVDIEVSHWLLNFSVLLFFSLACVKRCTELFNKKSDVQGRGYIKTDFYSVLALGVSSGLISILIALLYFQSTEVKILYSNPQKLWLITPLLLFWVSRIWVLTNRGVIHDDPVLFAIKDKSSWFCLMGILGILYIAK